MLSTTTLLSATAFAKMLSSLDIFITRNINCFVGFEKDRLQISSSNPNHNQQMLVNTRECSVPGIRISSLLLSWFLEHILLRSQVYQAGMTIFGLDPA
jgi:hypothetical protein